MERVFVAAKNVGETCEFGHFTVEAIVLDANCEDFNENAGYSLYAINDYTEEVPMADSFDANGSSSDNNTSTMYMITTDHKAVLVDLGNGAVITAAHFGEDTEDEAVLKAIDEEYRELIDSLVGNRELSILITHNHLDHVGYHTALAGRNIKIYFPKNDYSEEFVERFGDFSATYDLELFVPNELTLEFDGLTIETLACSGHTEASTIYILGSPVITYHYNEAGEPVSSDAVYHVLTGDAIGSGSSGWIFSVDGFNKLASSIGPVYDKLASCGNYWDYLSDKEKTDAGIHIDGGHSWQIRNRFGDMAMDLRMIENLKTLIEKIPEGSWVEEGREGKTIEELLREGKVVIKPVENPMVDTTIYYGPTLETVAGITTRISILKEITKLT